jgi:hypothetical protein
MGLELVVVEEESLIRSQREGDTAATVSDHSAAVVAVPAPVAGTKFITGL